MIKMFVILVISINGVLLHFYLKPRLKLIDWTYKIKESGRVLRRIAVAGGAISVTSWFAATILGSLDSIPLQFGHALLIYLGLLVVAVLGGQLFEMLTFNRRR